MNNKYGSNQSLKTEVFSKQAKTHLVTVHVDHPDLVWHNSYERPKP